MKNTIHITLPGDRTLEASPGSTLLEIERQSGIAFTYPILGAKVDNELKSLSETVASDCSVRFLDGCNEEGRRIYQASLSFVMMKAFYKMFPKGKLVVNHSVLGGNFCTPDTGTGQHFRPKHLRKLKEEMEKIIEASIPFESELMSPGDARRMFAEQGREDLANLLNYIKDEKVEIYTCNGYRDCFFMKCVPDTGYLKYFDLEYMAPGFILRFPRSSNPTVMLKYQFEKQLFNVFYDHKSWVSLLGVSDVVSLNEIIDRGEINDLIRVAEAMHEKKIAAIADLIALQKESLRVILIAGPSSSGKTTFAQRLAVQLRVNGLKPIAISVDDYFLDRERTPVDENGEYNFEVLEALDLELFNEHLTTLLDGGEVEIPRFDFTEGKSVPSGKKLKVTPDQPIIIEGIHGLNDRLTESVARENKFKIYISPLTQLNLDNHNRIHTTDTRIFRRMVRDKQFRGRDALGTLEKWESVRSGERAYIFPFQEEADAMFNSFLIYEICVLKQFVEESLKDIDPSRPEYSEAQRLLELMQFFRQVGTDEIPPNSILREFIGATCFFKADI